MIIEPESRVPSETRPVDPPKEEENTQRSEPLKYGPLGPGDRRSTGSYLPTNDNSRSTIGNLDSEDELDSSSDESEKKRSSPQIAYAPLELDSDVESDLSSIGPRSRKRVPSKDYDDHDHSSSKSSSIKRWFPNPDHYEDPLRSKTSRKPNSYQDGSSKTGSFEFSKRSQERDVPCKQGDFNEVGIPIVDPFPEGKDNSGDTTHSKDVKSLIDRYEQNASQETLNEDRLSVKSTEDARSRAENRMGIPLVAMVPGRPSSSRGQSSSGFGSLADVQDKSSDPRSERRATPSSESSAKGSKPTYQTDL